MNEIETDNKRAFQLGSALVYILIAIALLAALTASFMRPSSQQTTAQGAFNAVTELKSQLEFIRSSIQECVLTYPEGDSGLIGTTNTPFPINPSDTYLASTAPTGEEEDVQHLGCPGNPGDSNDHAKIFGGSSGKFLPPPPNLFESWKYYNGVDGVFYYTSTDKTDAFLQTAMLKLDEDYSECQADVINTSGGAEELTSTATADDPKCLANHTCFRLWVIIQPSAVYNGDSDDDGDGTDDEASCP